MSAWGLLKGAASFGVNMASGLKNIAVGTRVGGKSVTIGGVTGVVGGKISNSLGSMALNSPRSALALTGLGAGAYALSQSGPGQAPSGQAMSAIAQAAGTSVGTVSPVFQESTGGLVQGMHKNRHSGR